LKKFIVISLLFVTNLNSQETIHGAGASFPYPIYQAWALDYYRATKIRINYQSVGSGNGLQQIINRSVEFGASDAPIEEIKLKKENMLQFPVIIGGVVPIVNIEGVPTNALKLSGKTLFKIFTGEITMWDDPEIIRTNKNLKLPSKKITTVTRSDVSGTTAIFINYFASLNPSFKEKIGTDKSIKWLGINAKGNEGITNYVKKIKNSIGYVEYTYVKKNNLSYIQLKNAAGFYINPTVESFKAAATHADWNSKKHFYLWMVNAPGKDSWPITGASFILLPKEKISTNKKVANFYNWVFKNGDERALKEAYIPLPHSLKEKIRIYWSKYFNLD
jgi:phosphate transport system substrate-binding protein